MDNFVNGGISLPTLRVGSTGIYVRFLQIALTLLGYNPGSVDGIFGPRTEAAVKKFQRDQGLLVDGVVGRMTWAALGEALSEIPLPPPFPTLRRGSTGDFVVLLQAALTSLGYNPGPVDGIFGPLTEAAVIEFQTDNGLVPDGIVGPLTWSALLEAVPGILPPS